MKTTTIHQTKTHLSRYIAEISEGKSDGIIIKKYNKPVARIIPYNLEEFLKTEKPKPKRVPGKYKGKGFWISENFDDSMEDDFGPLFPVE